MYLLNFPNVICPNSDHSRSHIWCLWCSKHIHWFIATPLPMIVWTCCCQKLPYRVWPWHQSCPWMYYSHRAGYGTTSHLCSQFVSVATCNGKTSCSPKITFPNTGHTKVWVIFCTPIVTCKCLHPFKFSATLKETNCWPLELQTRSTTITLYREFRLNPLTFYNVYFYTEISDVKRFEITLKSV